MPVSQGGDWRVLLSALAESCYFHGVALQKGGHCVISLQEFLSPDCKEIENRMRGGAPEPGNGRN